MSICVLKALPGKLDIKRQSLSILLIHKGCLLSLAPLTVLYILHVFSLYSKPCVKRSLSRRPKIGFHDQLSLNAGQKYCGEHSTILSTFFKLPFIIKIFALSILEWPFYTGFTVVLCM